MAPWNGPNECGAKNEKMRQYRVAESADGLTNNKAKGFIYSLHQLHLGLYTVQAECSFSLGH